MGARDELRKRLALAPVVRAYLFGSESRGDAGPLSDVDLAVLPEPALDDAGRWQLKLGLTSEAAAAFGRRHADVVLLDEAPPGLAFHAIQGEILLDRSPSERDAFEARIMSRYHDRLYYDERWTEATLQRFLRGGFA